MTLGLYLLIFPSTLYRFFFPQLLPYNIAHTLWSTQVFSPSSILEGFFCDKHYHVPNPWLLNFLLLRRYGQVLNRQMMLCYVPVLPEGKCHALDSNICTGHIKFMWTLKDFNYLQGLLAIYCWLPVCHIW